MCAPAVGSPPGFRRDVRHCHPQAVQVLSTPTNSTGIKRVAIVVWVGHDISCMISPVPMNYSCLWRWVQKWREKLKKKANLLASSSHFVSAPLLVPLLSSAPSLFLSPFLCSPCLLLSFSFPSERFLYSYQPPTSVLSPFFSILSYLLSSSLLVYFLSISSSCPLISSPYSRPFLFPFIFHPRLLSPLELSCPPSSLFPSPFLPSHLLVSSPLFPSPFLSSHLLPTAFLTSSFPFFSPCLLSQFPPLHSWY